MKQSSLFRLPRLILPAFCIAVACAHFSAERAMAGCGGYVHVNGQAPAHGEMGLLSGHDSLGHNSFEHGDVGQLPSDLPRRGSRCSGPHCSNGIPRPLGLPKAPTTAIERQPALVMSATAALHHEPRFGRDADDVVAPRIFSAAIYRPPR